MPCPRHSQGFSFNRSSAPTALKSADPTPHVQFRLGEARRQVAPRAPLLRDWTLAGNMPWAQIYRTHDGYLLRFADLADFEISCDAGVVQSWPAPGVPFVDIEHLFLNQVLPLALSKRGRLVFHASAVEIDGVAVAFMAESGRGKSTLAASFATSGSRFLTDNGLFVETAHGETTVLPGHPSIRLWADSEGALVQAPARKAPPLGFSSKSRFLTGDQIAYCDTPRRLERILFLGAGEINAVTIEEVPRAVAFVELARHSFLLDAKAPEVLASHFDGISRLARLPICFRLDFPRRFEELPAVREAIVACLASRS